MKPWYAHDLDDTSEIANKVFDQVRHIEQKQLNLATRNNLLMSAYTGRSDAYWEDWNINISDADVDEVPNLDYSENVVASVVDTVHSNIAKSRPKATPVVRKGEFKLYRSGRKLDLFLYGLFLKQAFKAHAEAFLDSEIVTIGAVKVTQGYEGDFIIERVHPDELVVDQTQCVSSQEPREVHQRSLVHKDKVLSWVEGDDSLVKLVEECQMKSSWSYSSWRTPSNRDYLVVIESYFAALGDKPGRHSVCIDGVCLEYEEWELERAPYIWFRWKSPRKGFHGYPLAESILPYQIRLNELNDTIKRGQDLYAVPRTWLHQGTKPIQTKLDNEIGKVYEYTGDVVPKTDIWPGASTEIYNEREREIRRAFEQEGVSQFSAQATLPSNARLDSSKALREFSLRDDRRHAPQAIRYEESFLDLASLIIDLASLSYKDSKVSIANSGFYRSVNWSEIKLGKDDYCLTLEASSTLNMTPAARKDEVNSLVASGLINPEEAIYLIHHADVEAVLKRHTDARDAIEAQIDQILDGEAVSPWPEMNLQLAVEIATAEMNRLAQFPDAPTDIVNNLQTYISQAIYFLNPPQQELPSVPTPGIDPATAGLIQPGPGLQQQPGII